MKKIICSIVIISLMSCNSTLKNESSMKATQFRFARPTNQLDKVIAFYTKGLGLKIIGSFEKHDGYDGVMLGLPDEQYHLEFTQHESKSPVPAPTKENLLVIYFKDEHEYFKLVEKIKGIGAREVTPENPYWLGKSITFEDPDGWRIVLFNGVFQGK